MHDFGPVFRWALRVPRNTRLAWTWWRCRLRHVFAVREFTKPREWQVEWLGRYSIASSRVYRYDTKRKAEIWALLWRPLDKVPRNIRFAWIRNGDKPDGVFSRWDVREAVFMTRRMAWIVRHCFKTCLWGSDTKRNAYIGPWYDGPRSSTERAVRMDWTAISLTACFRVERFAKPCAWLPR